MKLDLLQLYISPLVRLHLKHAGMHCLGSIYMHKDINAIESIQKFACKVPTHSWFLAIRNFMSLTDLLTLERSIQLKLCHLYKVALGTFMFFFPNNIILLIKGSGAITPQLSFILIHN